jgi:rhodanese-related sulfurtransferase
MKTGICILLAATTIFADADDWTTLKQRIRTKYPTVREITTVELAAWLGDPKRPAPVLLDVRAKEEFAVSHLRSARQVNPSASVETAAGKITKDTPIVTYCSVGYRSSAMAERLQQAGFTNVRQLEGSIFQWANEGRPVYRGDKQVNEVHPYNKTWGKYLNKKFHAPVRPVKASNP